MFRNRVCGVVCAVAILTMVSVVQADPRLTKLSNRVYGYVGGAGDYSPAHSFGANVGFVVGDNGVLVIDTLTSAAEGKKLLADIRSVTDKPVRWVVNTHHHLDHTGGNCVFAAQGADIIAQENAASALIPHWNYVMSHLADYTLTQQDMEGTTVVPVSILFRDSVKIDAGGITAEVKSFGCTHSPGSSIVYLPSERILFAGDILFTDCHPFLAEGDLRTWVRALNRLMGMDVEKIIPGHGPVSGKKDLQAMKQYLMIFDKEARKVVATAPDKTDIPAMAERLKAVLPQRANLSGLIAGNLSGKYLSKKNGKK